MQLAAPHWTVRLYDYEVSNWPWTFIGIVIDSDWSGYKASGYKAMYTKTCNRTPSPERGLLRYDFECDQSWAFVHIELHSITINGSYKAETYQIKLSFVLFVSSRILTLSRPCYSTFPVLADWQHHTFPWLQLSSEQLNSVGSIVSSLRYAMLVFASLPSPHFWLLGSFSARFPQSVADLVTLPETLYVIR